MRYFPMFLGMSSVLCLVMMFQRSSGGLSARAMASVVMDEQTYPVVIIGGGIGGLTAGLYCGQAQMPALVIQGPKQGGALAQSHSVRNWPGVADEPGATIVDRIRAQAEQGVVTLSDEKVVRVDFKQWPYQLELAQVTDELATRTIKALAVVIATGTEPNLLGIPGESGHEGYWGKGVSNCAVCEGSLFKDKEIVIVGGGDAAITEASYLQAIVANITILVRKDAFRAKDTRTRDLVLSKPNIKVLYNTELKAIYGDNSKVTNVALVNNQTKNEQQISIDGVFLAIGSRPNTALFKDQLALDTGGFIKLSHHQQASLPGVFAVGDVCDAEFVQAVTAAGDGCKAALQAIKLLKDIGYDPLKNHAVKADSERAIVIDPVIELKTMQDLQRYVFNNPQPVVIDMFATWCIPCQTMAPLFHKIAAGYVGKVTFLKWNIQNSNLALNDIMRQLAGQPVQSVPTFLLVQKGKEVGRMLGACSEASFVTAIQNTFGDL